MIAICDVYDALALKRSYKKDYPPDKIYEVMMMDKGKAFSPQLLDKFFQFVGLWPVGTIAVLSDGRVGVVRQVNEHDITRPVVEIIEGEGCGEKIDLSNNVGLSIAKALNPRGQGKNTSGILSWLVRPVLPFNHGIALCCQEVSRDSHRCTAFLIAPVSPDCLDIVANYLDMEIISRWLKAMKGAVYREVFGR